MPLTGTITTGSIDTGSTKLPPISGTDTGSVKPTPIANPYTIKFTWKDMTVYLVRDPTVSKLDYQGTGRLWSTDSGSALEFTSAKLATDTQVKLAPTLVTNTKVLAPTTSPTGSK